MSTRVVIAGSSGFIGQRLISKLESSGHEICRLVRDRQGVGPGAAFWDPQNGIIDADALDGAQALINLSGHNISANRWSPRVKKLLRDSRLDSTRLLVETMATLAQPPGVMINASATGFYGDRGNEVLDERSPMGSGFLAELSRDWESAALTATEAGTRVVLARLGIVVGDGGAVDKMLPIFKLGLGGPLGDGKQWWSWIAIDDVVEAFRQCITDEAISGPVNFVSPTPVTCTDFAKTLASVLGRPAILPTPAFALRLATGEMADALLLASARVEPGVLVKNGYRHIVPDLEQAFQRALTNS